MASRESSNADLKAMVDSQQRQQHTEDLNKSIKKPASLQDRSKIPSSFYLSVGLIITAHICGNIWSLRVLYNWAKSMRDAGNITFDTLNYLRDLTSKALHGNVDNWLECGQVSIFTALVGSLLYVLLIAPLRAGFWTGPRSTKHKMHRYMGLAYLIQYFAAWTQYLSNYEAAKDSYLPHFIALNGRSALAF